MMTSAFDTDLYLQEQSEQILKRVNKYDKLYLEFGGKLFSDLHAQRVLPGFDADAKVKMLSRIKEKVEVIICVYAWDIERNKVRADFGITYDQEVLKLIDDLRAENLEVNSVVITRYEESPATLRFRNLLEKRGIQTYTHSRIRNYPSDIDFIVSEEGYGKNCFIPTQKPIVVITGAWAWSGKLATCLNQLYHEHQQGRSAGYAKFETFPVRNLPLKHPLNIAYEAATLDLNDVNMIDPFHLEQYGTITTNYNRDVEAFPLLKKILEKITWGKAQYASPTDMGVNAIATGIKDEKLIAEAASQEIIRRYFHTACAYKKGQCSEALLQKAKLLMQQLNLSEEQRAPVLPARTKLQYLQEYENTEDASVLAFQLANGQLITGKKSSLMDAPSAALLNTLKVLSNCDDAFHLLSPEILQPIITLKKQMLKRDTVHLELDEVLIALSISAVTNPLAKKALTQIENLAGIQAHSTHILSRVTEQMLKKLGIDATSDPVFLNTTLYYGT